MHLIFYKITRSLANVAVSKTFMHAKSMSFNNVKKTLSCTLKLLYQMLASFLLPLTLTNELTKVEYIFSANSPIQFSARETTTILNTMTGYNSYTFNNFQ